MNPLLAIVTVAVAALIAAAAVAIAGPSEGTTTVITAIFTFATTVIATGMVVILREVRQVAIHTNSMKDELVAEVRKASLAEGAAEERANPT